MGNPTTEPTIRISDVARAIGMTVKALRNWMKKISVVKDRDGGSGWRAFSFADVAILSIMKQLVGFGVEVTDAEAWAYLAAEKAFGPLLQHSKNMPPKAFLAGFTGKYLHLFHGEEDDYLVVTNFQEEPPRYLSRLTVDLHLTIGGAFYSLARSGLYSLDGLEFGAPVPIERFEGVEISKAETAE